MLRGIAHAGTALPLVSPATDNSVIFAGELGAVGDGGDSTAALQKAIDLAAPRRGTVHIPNGFHLLSRPLKLRSFVTLAGEGRGTILDNQWAKLDAPQIINGEPDALVGARINSLAFRGGTHAIKLDVTHEIADLYVRDCVFELQTEANFAANKMLQTSTFEKCVFGRARRGLVVVAPAANMNSFIACDFVDHSLEHVQLHGGLINHFLCCRFEGGGVAGPATLSLDGSSNTAFQGCFFEATHPLLLREHGSDGSTSFSRCHFTGGLSAGQRVPYRFESDGVLTLDGNTATLVPVRPARMQGANVAIPWPADAPVPAKRVDAGRDSFVRGGEQTGSERFAVASIACLGTGSGLTVAEGTLMISCASLIEGRSVGETCAVQIFAHATQSGVVDVSIIVPDDSPLRVDLENGAAGTKTLFAAWRGRPARKKTVWVARYDGSRFATSTLNSLAVLPA